MKERIEVTISESGVVAEAHGFKGKGCESAMKFIEEIADKKKGKRKSEYYLKPPVKQKIKA